MTLSVRATHTLAVACADKGAAAEIVDAINSPSQSAASFDTISGKTGTTGTFAISLTDNLADAFSVKESSNKYITFVTTNSSESVDVLKALRVDSIKGKTGTTGTFAMSLTDNLADAFSVKESTNAYLTFVTTNSAESVTVAKTLTVTSGTIDCSSGATDIKIPDNNATALRIREATNDYIIFVTTDSAETVSIQKDLTMADAKNIVLDVTTGTKIGTATGQKLGFWNAIPVAQQVLATGGGATADDIITLLQTLGLCKQS